MAKRSSIRLSSAKHKKKHNTNNNKYMDREWQENLLPILLEKFESAPLDFNSYKEMLTASKLIERGFSFLRSLLSEKFFSEILPKLQDSAFLLDRFETNWGKTQKELLPKEFRINLINEQIYWAWFFEKVAVFYFLSDGTDSIEPHSLKQKCKVLEEHQLTQDDVQDLLLYNLTYSSSDNVNISSFTKMFWKIDPPQIHLNK